MGSSFAALKCFKVKGLFRLTKLALFAIATFFFTTLTALAHHPLGGKTPSNFIEGFLFGVGHPVIGLAHLIFVIASGLLAAAVGRTLVVPITGFIICGVGGTFVSTLMMDSIFPI
ncbi:MAG: HupE/UreJ family protein [Cyanobacteria bacterium P01_H01_bin.21]